MARDSKLLGIALIACLLAGCQADEPQAAAAERALQVITVEPSRAVTSFTLTGSIAAQVESNLSFRSDGQIIERLVDVGARVRKGQVLARINPTIQRADLEAAQAEVASANAQAKQAAAAFSRAQNLIQNGYTTRVEFDNADRALKVARSTVASAEARLESARERLSFTELYADADGIVTVREHDVDETVQAAATVFTVALDGPRDAVFDLYEGLMIKGRKPAEITVALATDGAVKTSGRIRQIAPSVDQKRGTVRVKVELATTPDKMTLGAAVTGTGALFAVEAFVLPAAAMTALEGDPAVWVFDSDAGTVSLRPVHVATYQSATVTIDEGLQAGERVVVEGGKLLRPGQRIAAIEKGLAR